jgi:hypothetical protein
MINNKDMTDLTSSVNQMYSNSLIELPSVGSLLDGDVGSVYPQMEDGSPDWDCEISLLEDEVSHEWLDALSEVDYLKVKPFLQK